MVRVINQETYDDIVKENMEEFDMSPEEAIKEAVAQFQAQGVDLSNIIKDMVLSTGEKYIVTATVNKLKELSTKRADAKALIKELDILKIECNKDIAHRIKAGKDGAYPVLLDLIETRIKYDDDSINSKERDEVIIKSFNTLIALMEMQPDLLDARGANLIKSVLEEETNDEILAVTMKWLAVCFLKHENNRQMMFGKNIVENFYKIITGNTNKKVLSETLNAIRKLTLDDDIRVQFGKAHDHAKEMGIKMLGPLTKLLKENTSTNLVSDLLLSISSLLVRHELCKSAAEDGVPALFELLPRVYDDVVLTQHAITLITALAGNDDVKRELVKSGMVPIIVALLNRHSANPVASAAILKCIAALSLREPDHSLEFFENGAPEAIVDCLKIHQNNATVVKNACWAIRNMMVRSREQNAKFLELGVEAILNSCHELYSKDFGYDIKSALRELDCDVKLEEQWTGKGVELEQ